MKPISSALRALVTAVLCLLSAVRAGAGNAPSAADAEPLRMVMIFSRHGVRSPTDPGKLSAYAARPWPAWNTPPGYLTAHGAALMTIEGQAYRRRYAQAGLLPETGCPPAGAVFVWADVEQRTKATADALISGIAPSCGILKHVADATVDPIFHALPALGKADPIAARASVAGAIGNDPAALVTANRAAFSALESILGCAAGQCPAITSVPSSLSASEKTGLTSLSGPVELGSTAVEDFILEYADGMPMADVGWGRVDAPTLLWLSQLHMLKYIVTTETSYTATAQGSNLLATLGATIDQSADGKRRAQTPVPPGVRFAAFVGHDTNLETLAGMLHVSWLIPGYQPNDTPPGGALVFELYAPPSGSSGAFVRILFSAQTLDELRSGTSLRNAAPLMVPVFLPGCPSFDCPLTTFDSVLDRAIDPRFVEHR